MIASELLTESLGSERFDAVQPFMKKMLKIDYINFSYAMRGIKVVANVREKLDLNSTPLKN